MIRAFKGLSGGPEAVYPNIVRRRDGRGVPAEGERLAYHARLVS